MIGYLSDSHNRRPQDPNRSQHRHHQQALCRRRRDPDYQYLQVKLVGSLTTVMILLLGTTTTITTGLPTPPSVHSTNNQQSYECDNRHYFVNDQVLADRWTQLCGWTNRSSPYNYQKSLPVGVCTGTDTDDNGNVASPSSSDERQLLVEALQRFLRDARMANDDISSSNLASVTYEEEPIQLQVPPPPPEKLAASHKRHSRTKLSNLLLNEQRGNNHRVKENDETLANDRSFLPFSDEDDEDDDIQRQVIFIQIPETMVNLHVHQPPPKTIVYVLPPKEETHLYRIHDMRGSNDPFGGAKVPPPAVHFLSNFGSNKIDTESLTAGRPHANQANLHGQSQSKSKYDFQHPNRNDQKVFLPIKGVPASPPIPAFIADRFNQRPHLSGQISATSSRANKDFEIVPAFNGYFYI